MLEIHKAREGEYRFVVKSEQGHPLLESVPFPDEDTAKRRVRELQPLVKNPVCFERRTDHLGRFQFTLRGPGGTVIGHSQHYRSEAGMENGITNTLHRISALEL